jgi:hypothetical protein
MRSRAIRRHHEERVKARVRKYYGGMGIGSPRQTGIIAHTRSLCSCWMCGNPRRHLKEVTVQEMRAEQATDG